MSKQNTTTVGLPKASKSNAAFLAKQEAILLALKDQLIDSAGSVSQGHLRTRAESDASGFGMHQADAGSDAYDRDFAFGILAREHDAVNEVNDALLRIKNGTYGICEISGEPILHARLEALPFTRYTVECQAQLEKEGRHRARVPVKSLFGLEDDEDEGRESEESDTEQSAGFKI